MDRLPPEFVLVSLVLAAASSAVMWILGRRFGRELVDRSLSRPIILRSLLVSTALCWVLVPFGAHEVSLPLPAWLVLVGALFGVLISASPVSMFTAFICITAIAIPTVVFNSAARRSAAKLLRDVGGVA
jgi:hypothetical protein